MGTLFSTGNLLSDSTINGADQSGYFSDVGSDFVPVDNSTYTDAGADPTTGNDSPNFLSGLDTALNDAFKAYAIAQTPTSQRGITAQQALRPSLTSSQLVAQKAQQSKLVGYVVVGLVVIVAIYFLIKAAK